MDDADRILNLETDLANFVSKAHALDDALGAALTDLDNCKRELAAARAKLARIQAIVDSQEPTQAAHAIWAMFDDS